MAWILRGTEVEAICSELRRAQAAGTIEIEGKPYAWELTVKELGRAAVPERKEPG